MGMFFLGVGSTIGVLVVVFVILLYIGHLLVQSPEAYWREHRYDRDREER